ncbi:hypothetical protein Q2K19_21685 [Micromonospora soli]|uniref:hypothetical protein n=1 Tax=Micromonospora sp. NBRC 110009 TaxID=3061627 RepID=UPI00267399C1|nr:hypothetical protein [Micromonospora sp. NBRC 110009]WKT96802.1 hypothetical protein Q2K19_21685 [Micromonospora sp. NBRC 110009]
MKTLARAALVCASSGVLALGLAATGGAAFAANPHSPGQTGQPSKECGEEDAAIRPASANAPGPGSPFRLDGGIAGLHYAGEQPQNSKNPKSVAQYDVACFQLTQNQ